MPVKSIFRALIVAVSIFLAGAAALGQSNLSVRGVAEDDTGAIIPRAQVTLLDSNEVEVAHTVANDLGEFAFTRLAAGDYSIDIEAAGFKKTQAKVTVAAGSAELQHIRMKIANVSQEITVKAGDPVAMDGNISSVEVNHDLLKSLPVKDDNPLAAAAVFLDPAANGAEGTKIVVDGVETTDLDVPSSSVKSVAVNKNPYSAEFSRPGKGRIEVITRPGSLTRVHHHFVTTFRNSSLDATNAFATERPQRSRSFWEGDINGPLFGQNGSFYLGGEYLHDEQSSFVHAITPTAALTQTVDRPERTWHLLGRVDYRLNSLNTLSARYSFSRDNVDNQGVGVFDLASRAYNSQSRGHEVRIAETALLSVNFSNEIRFAFKDKDHSATPLSNAPARIVLGAFNGGGAQINQDLGERSYELQNLSTWIRGRHTLRFGVTAKRRDIEVTDASNFGGTFSYSDLASFAAGHPFLFTMNQGTPSVSFSQNEYSYFVQDEMRLRPNLTVMLGLRHELQSNLDDHNNLAPRFGFSYAPGKGGLVLRAGAGIFYDRLPWLMQQQTLLFDNNHIHRIVMQNPAFNQIPPAGLAASPGSIVTIDPAIRSPYVTQATVGVDKRFGSNNSISVEFATMRGLKLYRTRNLNAPLPSTGLPPNPAFINVNQFQSTGSSRANSLSVTYRAAVKQRAEFLAQYTLSKSTDDTSGMFSQPSDDFNLALERGRSDFDRRHRFNLAGIFQLPWGFRLGTITSISSGIPFNITTGSDTGDDADNVVANDRPAGVPRNSGNGPMYSDVDIRLSRKIVLGPKREHGTRYLELRIDAFNALNQVNATNYVGVITSPLFGRANSSLPARQIQLSVKASF
ncbi:MAG TPA: TonB-dependent receptor [Candidatus Angelobacter sp.]|nr:TonB-dependent receptor [Candidatus Angelobacter sp.]